MVQTLLKLEPGSSGLATEVTFLTAQQEATAAVIWMELEARFANQSITCSWDWTESWLRKFGSTVQHRFAVLRVGDQPCGIALVCENTGRRQGPVRLRSVHIGTAGEPDAESVYVEYNRILVDPAHRQAFARSLLKALDAERWDEIRLDGFTEEDAAPFLALDERMKARRESCPYLSLSEVCGDDVVASLGYGTRQRIRRSARGFGEIETEWAETAEDALNILDELIDLHQQRWSAAGESGAFASQRTIEFHRELVSRLLRKDQVVLFRVRAQRGTIGCLYSFIEHGQVLFYQSGLAQFDDSRLKPGLVAHSLCMQACVERGLDVYNFLASDSRYKRELSTCEEKLVWAVSRRGTPKLWALDRLRILRSWVREQPKALDA